MHKRELRGWLWDPSSKLAGMEEKMYVLAVGPTSNTQPEAFGKLKLSRGESRNNWACFQITAIEREEYPYLPAAKRILITATGDIANTDMGWKNAEKTTVGRDWGRAPVLVEGPAATIELPGGGKFKAWALDERGQRREELPVADGKLTIGPQFKTLWYEVERQ